MWNPDVHHEIRIDQQQYLAKTVLEYTVIENGERKKVKAKNIIEVGISDLIGRKILKYSINQGDNRDGSGPGFLGLLLDDDPQRNLKKEWLIVTVLGADEFTILDGQLVGPSASTISGFSKPLIYYQGPILVDKFGPVVNGSIIREAILKDESFTVKIESHEKTHILEIFNKDSRLTPLINFFVEENGKRKYMPRMIFKSGQKIGEFLVFMEENGHMYV